MVVWDFYLSVNLLTCSRGLLGFDPIARLQWVLPGSWLLKRKVEGLPGWHGALRDLGWVRGQDVQVQEECWEKDCLSQCGQCPPCMSKLLSPILHQILFCGLSELHTQGDPCNFITNLIFGHYLPHATVLLSFHRQLFFGHSWNVNVAFKKSSLCQDICMNEMIM